MENANEILPNIWLGNLYSSKDESFLTHFKIKLVINCTKHNIIPYFYDKLGIICYRLPVYDQKDPGNNEIFLNYKNQLIDVIHQYINQNKPVLIHCYAGAQRSATLLAFYIQKYYSLNIKKCIKLIKEKREIAFEPEPTFKEILFSK